MKISLIAALLINIALAGTSIDLKKSKLRWEGTKVTGKHFGKIPFKKGEVTFKDGMVATGNFVVDMNTFTVEDIQGEWAKKLSDHMKSADFFEISKYPTATLKVKKVTKDTMSGDLTIKGKTNPVSFKYKKEGDKYSGLMVFNRTKFGMTYKSKNFFKNLGDKVIHDDVKVNFEFYVKAPATKEKKAE